MLLRTAAATNLEDVRIKLSNVDNEVEMIAALAYVQTLRWHMHRAQVVIGVCRAITMILALFELVKAFMRERQTTDLGAPATLEAADGTRTL